MIAPWERSKARLHRNIAETPFTDFGVRLTEVGREFIPVLDGMKAWSEGYIEKVLR